MLEYADHITIIKCSIFYKVTDLLKTNKNKTTKTENSFLLETTFLSKLKMSHGSTLFKCR